jgi:hypothetical protein
VVAGDKLSLEADFTGVNPSTTRVYFGFVFVPTNEGDALILGNEQTSIDATNARYIPLMHQSDATGWSATDNRYIAGVQSTIKNLYVELGTAPGSGKSLAFAVRQGSANTAIVATVTNTNTTANDIDSFSCANFDLLSFGVTPSGSPTIPAWIAWGCVINATVSTAYTKDLSDTLAVKDTLTKSPGKALSENIAIIDTVARATGKTLLETISVVDQVNATRVISIIREEVITIIDDVRARISGKALDETISIEDTNRTDISGKQLQETITIEDTVTKSTGKLLNEQMTIVDSLAKGVTKTLVESIKLIDQAVSFAKRARGFVMGIHRRTNTNYGQSKTSLGNKKGTNTRRGTRKM